MTLKLLFSSGEQEFVQEEWHPLLQSPFIRTLKEVQQEENGDNTKIVQIPLPASIEYKPMMEFETFLFNCAAGEHNEMDFGKHHDLTYQEVCNRDWQYCRWAMGLRDPSTRGIKNFLSWLSFYRGGKRPSNDILPSILPIAKFFQLDLCAGCGIMGRMEGLESVAEASLKPCERTCWPRAPVTIPEDTGAIVGNEETREQAWKAAIKEREEEGKIVCCNDDLLCRDCIAVRGCRTCQKYECSDCQADKETSKLFQEWHEKQPPASEDEYRMGKCSFQPIDISSCAGCNRQICPYCSTECEDCHKLCCERCNTDLTYWCEPCRSNIEENEDRVLDRYVCEPCFDSRPHHCECGAPSYDPREEEEEDSFDDSEDDESMDHYDPNYDDYMETGYYEDMQYFNDLYEGDDGGGFWFP